MNHTNSNTTVYTSKIEKNKTVEYPFFSSSLKYGAIAGGLIALFFFLLQVVGMENAIGLKYVGYSILGVLLAIGLGDYERFLKTGTTFKNGMVYVAQISLFAGVTLVIINALTFFIGSGLTFSKYGIEATTFPSLLMLSGAIFLEVMVAGLIFGFIALQYLKSRKDYDG